MTDDQFADILGTLQDVQQIEPEGSTVRLGYRPAQGRVILIEASAGMSLIVAERPTPDDADADLALAVERVSVTRDGQLWIPMSGAIGTMATKVVPERAAHAAAQLVARLRPDAA